MSWELTLPLEFAVLIISVAVLSFLARKTNQPPIIAYIAAGLILGPVFLSVLGESELTSLMSELGLGFLLFLVGIEMKIDEIKNIFHPIVRIAIGQTILQTILAFAVAYLLGFTLMETIIISLCTVFGATPIVVKLLTDKDEISSLPGKLDVGVLVIQDIYLIIILTLLGSDSLTNPAAIATSLGKIFVVGGVIGIVSYISAKHILPRLFDEIAEKQDILFIHGLAWGFLLITLSQELGLSLEIGAFLAGLSLGQIPYSTEFQERIRPLTDFFMMIFFVSIGLSLNAETLLLYWKEAILASLILMPGNFLIMFYLIDRENFTPETSFLGGLNLTQVSEFSLVVGALAVSQGYVGSEILGYLSIMALLTMSISVYLITYNREIYNWLENMLIFFYNNFYTIIFSRTDGSANEKDIHTKSLENHAVIVGYDEMGKDALEALEEHFDDIVIIDNSPQNVEELSKSKYEYIYGDFGHAEIRGSSNISQADFVLSLSHQLEINKKVIEDSKNATIFVKATTRDNAAELYDMGAHYVIMKNVLTGDKIGEYIKDYFNDRDLFNMKIEDYMSKLHWSGRNG